MLACLPVRLSACLSVCLSDGVPPDNQPFNVTDCLRDNLVFTIELKT